MPTKVWDEMLLKWREGTPAEVVKANNLAGAPVVELVAYQTWMKETSTLFGGRGDLLKRVDYALAQYQAEPCALALWVLKRQFTEWKGSKADWTASSRNQNDLVTLLDRQLAGGRDVDILSPELAFMEEGLIHARLGIVYLYAHLDCDNFFNILTHGVLDVASAGIEYGSDFLTDADRAAGIDPDKDQRISDLGTASSTMQKTSQVTDKIEAAVRNKIGNQSLQGTSIDLQPKTRYATPVWLTYDAPPPPSGPLRALWEKIKEKLYAVAEKLYQMVRAKIDWGKDKAKEIWADKREAAVEYVPGLLRKLVNFLLGKLIATVAPLVGGALDIAKGIFNTIEAVVDKVSEWQDRKNVKLLAGTPTTTCEAIRGAMTLCIGEGLYDTLKGTANLAMDVGMGVSAGGTAIAKLVIAVVEALTTTIYRLVEIQRMRNCFADARGMWLVRDSEHALYKHPIVFNNWFKSYALTTPALAMLALNSGICGDKMHFLQMFQDDTKVIAQASFDAGVKYVDDMKIWGASYLTDAAFNFVSNDAMTRGLLELAKSHKDPGESVAKRLISGFLNG
jgi:hypothetical protein